MYVYFIQGQSTRLIKIGMTRGYISDRLAQLQSYSPDKLKLLKAVKGDSKYERGLHQQFASVRSHGEWFYPSRGLMAFIDSLKGSKATDQTWLKRRRQIAFERAKKAKEMANTGLAVRTIAERLGVCKATISRDLKKNI